ncbi:MAG: ribosomal-processing cysteine protease Prp [Spirochaetota bacterium]
MIKISVESGNECLVKVEVRGHGEGIKGKDIVCAAVSSVVQSAVAGLLHFNPGNLTWKMKKGYIYFAIRGFPDHSTRLACDAVVATMILGIKAIAREYPKKLHLKLPARYNQDSSP